MGIKPLLSFILLALPVVCSAAWQLVTTEQGKRVEIDRASIIVDPGGESMAKGRIVLDKPIVDPKTSASYRIIEVLNRFDCNERTHATLRRSYFKEEGELLRQEEVKSPIDMPVRSGSPDDKLLREVCRPQTRGDATLSASMTADKVNEAAGGLRKLNEELVEKEVQKELKGLTSPSGPARPASAARKKSDTRHSTASAREKKPAAPATTNVATNIPWSYEGTGGPDTWGRLKPEFASCSSGRRQSPIDLRDGIAVDLAPIQFVYRPATFRVSDNERNMQIAVYGGGLNLLGKNYELIRMQFHRPSEITIKGKRFAMEAQLLHKADDGKLAIVSVLLDQGMENPVVQMALNNLPLEKSFEVAPPSQRIDVSGLLPENRRYYTFMGSLTTPPCTEEVLWLVLMQPQQISPEQLAIFERLYKPNARPIQPGFGRLIKESR
ncbi:carbonic anhydrase family protein [Propionivibrio sp.]|uniref:carbonic anhydrase n=1 Tax=Propionivibrio sp. TaxID=2212460 RepID=UPI0025D1B988|nr:carbonic anhydrase family protein [Propionivibrio sp.]MBK7354859.1 carbonic anhydrase family protein [Propionivibrio sp.]MBK8402227.1 carbonic anhydrase family protein [Propionivibrio sp.]MBK8745917.1 carbonic anhydrase family protein [Propionivibrio sp.]MBK8892684.1 carbonic anhydrase family protein [Propionivibrio sp.]